MIKWLVVLAGLLPLMGCLGDLTKARGSALCIREGSTLYDQYTSSVRVTIICANGQEFSKSWEDFRQIVGQDVQSELEKIQGKKND